MGSPRPTEIPTETPSRDDVTDLAFVLILRGWPVLLHGADMELWRIGDAIMTDDELVQFAASKGIHLPPLRVQ